MGRTPWSAPDPLVRLFLRRSVQLFIGHHATTRRPASLVSHASLKHSSHISISPFGMPLPA